MVGPFSCFHEQLSIECADYIAESLWTEKNLHFIRKFYKCDPQRMPG